jgi:transposase
MKDFIMIAVGIDISKYKIDVFYNNKSFVINNKEKDLRKFFKSLPSDGRIVMEATGKYHRLSHMILAELGFEVMLINPFQSRNFAKSMNVICKTDKVDAKILALYAERMGYKESKPLESIDLELQELLRYLEDLEKVRRDLEARLREAEGFVAKSLRKALASIEKEIAATREKLAEAVESNPAIAEKCELLTSIPGIGKQSAIMLLSSLRELGKLGKNKISALAGVAPRNNDSGTYRGKRYVKGGRRSIRASLYMPVLGAATQYNKRLNAIYKRLVAAGKSKKVALIACMRKLVIWANALLANKQKWCQTA